MQNNEDLFALYLHTALAIRGIEAPADNIDYLAAMAAHYPDILEAEQYKKWLSNIGKGQDNTTTTTTLDNAQQQLIEFKKDFQKKAAEYEKEHGYKTIKEHMKDANRAL
ncbi:MAG: hypothetical protein DRH24_08840, partial [Deltaproteobacteria bacterium]